MGRGPAIIAELYQINGTKTLVGRYRMSVQVTVQGS